MAEDDAGLKLVHLLRQVAVGLHLFGAEFAAANGLHPTDVRALIHLVDADRAGAPATPGWLGEQLAINSASVTALIDRLERLGHVRRVRDTADRRRVRLVLQAQAVELGWSFFGPLIGAMVAATGEFDRSELATVERFLITIDRVLAGNRHNRSPAGTD